MRNIYISCSLPTLERKVLVTKVAMMVAVIMVVVLSGDDSSGGDVVLLMIKKTFTHSEKEYVLHMNSFSI